MERKKIFEGIIWVAAVTACLLEITVLAHAEFRKKEPLSPPEPEKMIERLQQDFNLTDEQTAKVRVFMEESAKQEEEILKRYALNRDQFQILQKDLHMAREDFFKKIDGILTEKQKKTCGPHGGRLEDDHRMPPPPPPCEPCAP